MLAAQYEGREARWATPKTALDLRVHEMSGGGRKSTRRPPETPPPPPLPPPRPRLSGLEPTRWRHRAAPGVYAAPSDSDDSDGEENGLAAAAGSATPSPRHGQTSLTTPPSGGSAVSPTDLAIAVAATIEQRLRQKSRRAAFQVRAAGSTPVLRWQPSDEPSTANAILDFEPFRRSLARACGRCSCICSIRGSIPTARSQRNASDGARPTRCAASKSWPSMSSGPASASHTVRSDVLC